MTSHDLFSCGVICAFKFIQDNRRESGSNSRLVGQFSDTEEPFVDTNLGASGIDALNCLSHNQQHDLSRFDFPERYSGHWIAAEWSEIIQFNQDRTSSSKDMVVAPTWWCHVDADDLYIKSSLNEVEWLDRTVKKALLEETSKLISGHMKHLPYEALIFYRFAGGLLFEMLVHPVGDQTVNKCDVPVVIRSWLTKNCLLTALHAKGSSSMINVSGVSEVKEILAAGDSNTPQTIHEVIVLLACRLARSDDRYFRRYIFGAVDEVELKLMNRVADTFSRTQEDRRTQEDMRVFSMILSQEIIRISAEVIRVKWCLHAREETAFELLQYIKGETARSLLEGITKSTREMIEEQEAARGRLFALKDVIQNTVRSRIQDQSLEVQHNLGIFGCCGVAFSIIIGLFGMNVDGVPGAKRLPHAFILLCATLAVFGIPILAGAFYWLRLKKKKSFDDEDAEPKKLELQNLATKFWQESESHVQIRK